MTTRYRESDAFDVLAQKRNVFSDEYGEIVYDQYYTPS